VLSRAARAPDGLADDVRRHFFGIQAGGS